jgi:Zn-dependent metalloprotease
MKRVFTILLALTLLCQAVYSQNRNRSGGIKSIESRAKNLKGSLNDNAKESLRIQLRIPSDYEFRNQIISGAKDQTRKTDELGGVHERYSQYYKGIKIEHSDIRTHYFGDSLIWANGEYVDIPNIDVSIVVPVETAIQNAKKHIGATKYIWEDERACAEIRDGMDNVTSFCYPNPEIVIWQNMLDVDDTLFYVAYKVNIHAIEPFLTYDYVYVDAKTGTILNSVSQIDFVYGTAQTIYSGSKSISTQLNNSKYRLRGYDDGRSIETYDMNGKSSYSNASDFENNTNSWSNRTIRETKFNHRRRDGKAKPVKFNTNGLREGTYYLHVDIDGKVEKVQIVVKR